MAPVPRVMRRMAVRSSLWKASRTFLRAGRLREPSIWTKGISFLDNKDASCSRVLFHSEKIILNKRETVSGGFIPNIAEDNIAILTIYLCINVP
jgi:hypothetical protein